MIGPALGLMLAVACLFLPPLTALADEWHFPDVERVVAVGDVHGAYDALVKTLQHAGVIDDSLHWSGGRTHFISTGDLLDRGAESRRVMDLMMRLEREAGRAGGRVHQLLGNHEVMNLNGDLRYVADAEYTAFQDMESAKDREFWYQNFRAREPADSDDAEVRRVFDEKALPGYFGHRRAFRSDGIYGRWLLSRPFAIVVNDIAYVHGGLPPYVAEYGLAGVNGTLKDDLKGFMQTSEALQDMGALNPIDWFRETPDVLERLAEAGQLQGELLETAQKLVDFGASPLHGSSGPTWYRGTAACSALLEGDSLQVVLDKIGASRVVVGHTTTITRRVQQGMDGRVFEIDTGMLHEIYGGAANVLVIDNGEVSVVGQDGADGIVPIPRPLRVGHEAMAIDESALADLLTNGQIIDVAAAGAKWKLVRVRSDDKTVLAIFRERPHQENFVPELAAYKLDRLLHLGMVPVTVRRDIGGLDGTLQFVPAETLTERERVAAGRGKNPACAMSKQVGAMFIFDALVHNASRTPSSMLFEPGNWLLMLVDHSDSFGTLSSLPTSQVNADLGVGNQWRTALLAVDDVVLRRQLGDVLDEERLLALGKRRDALIALGD